MRLKISWSYFNELTSMGGILEHGGQGGMQTYPLSSGRSGNTVSKACLNVHGMIVLCKNLLSESYNWLLQVMCIGRGGGCCINGKVNNDAMAIISFVPHLTLTSCSRSWSLDLPTPMVRPPHCHFTAPCRPRHNICGSFAPAMLYHIHK
jgi:hypothetical protein